MEQKTLMKSNKRNNPQHSMLFENLINHIDPNGLIYDRLEFEVELYLDEASDIISPINPKRVIKDPLNYKNKHKVSKTIKQGELESMKVENRNIALTSYRNERLHNLTNYNVFQKNIKGTILFVEQDFKNLSMRISYKFYKPRYPRIVDNYANEPFVDDIF
jgi:hypothetical protein